MGFTKLILIGLFSLISIGLVKLSTCARDGELNVWIDVDSTKDDSRDWMYGTCARVMMCSF
jgi:hypothetical protein